MVAPVTFLLVDGENIDGVLGQILGHRPEPNERPRWDRVAGAAASWGSAPLKSYFFINATSGLIPGPFIQAIRSHGYTPVLLSGPGKVVDDAIVATLGEIGRRHGSVVLASHDADFAPALEQLLDHGHRVALACFTEYVAGQLLNRHDLELLDLERDMHAFLDDVVLPRVRIIPIDEFDPRALLGSAGLA
ncbi:conserved hypothetical protein [Acidimicrobium ferrooxidans DSM 10331]|uniref:NYN domain-containing protein n=1 Tax=Acidimicrobium ferrooxidans (strain DSM 10331 / JCM 15462 / NBRC 103882 / ICP) TaxID=525909 RepID=C7M2G9_ACIFD|nr:NYN domain-containing protein [Acidimicrobium ferrooxidans]ACU53213.1 conserved hypothetical protein [Acidimicrobium ferrooxidans DSM 10331]